jgi:lia operon protein LiaG
MIRRVFGVIFIAIGLLMLAAVGNHWFRWDLPFPMKSVDIKEQIAAGDIRHVNVRSGSSDVTVTRSDSDQIKVHLTGKAFSGFSKNVDLEIEQRRDTLELNVVWPKGPFFIIWADLQLTVELPEKKWDGVDIELGSGDTEVAGIKSGKIKVSTGSGDSRLTEAYADEIQIKAGSGDIETSRFESAVLEVEAGSGDIVLKDGTAAIRGRTGSGNIVVAAAQLRHDVNLTTGSGDVEVRLSQAPESLQVDYEGGSGEGRIHWDGFQIERFDEDGDVIRGKFGDGGTLLKVRTGSGNFTLY